MKRFVLVNVCVWLGIMSFGQTITQRLQKAFAQFEADPQLKHAISSLYVIDANTGKVVFDKNSRVGLAPASTQKIITSATAFELLGKDYRYKTELGYEGKMVDGILDGHLYFTGSGDPTLGSWRWDTTKDTFLMTQWWQEVRNAGIRKINGSVWFAAAGFSVKSIPDGWVWQDIGNYYGAGSYVLNWKENQYDVFLRSGNKAGEPVRVIWPERTYTNELTSAPKGTGDNAYVYYDQVISGTIPVGEPSFKISAASIDPMGELCTDFSWFLNSRNVAVEARERFDPNPVATGIRPGPSFRVISTHYSPALDSVIYWFNKKSINLYGEALVKTMAYEKRGFGSTDSGVAVVQEFWKQKGIDEHELNIKDGSG